MMNEINRTINVKTETQMGDHDNKNQWNRKDEK